MTTMEFRPITAAEAARQFEETGPTAEQARRRMLERMGLAPQERSAEAAREDMIRRGTGPRMKER